jgi:hypothetical protein
MMIVQQGRSPHHLLLLDASRQQRCFSMGMMMMVMKEEGDIGRPCCGVYRLVRILFKS